MTRDDAFTFGSSFAGLSLIILFSVATVVPFWSPFVALVFWTGAASLAASMPFFGIWAVKSLKGSK